MNMKLVIVVSCLLAFAASSAMAQCSFEIIVKTGNRKDAGTDARVSLAVSAADGPALVLPNLESHGESSPGHDYFEKGNIDRFVTSGHCMPSEPCNMLIKSDGNGSKSGWYVDFVQVTQHVKDGISSITHKWNVDQWLATDEAPNMLSASRNACGI